tara:strand:- start:496 stop:627 length:132 start_codon:yes stop_codon:yes gene_type:complete
MAYLDFETIFRDTPYQLQLYYNNSAAVKLLFLLRESALFGYLA